MRISSDGLPFILPIATIATAFLAAGLLAPALLFAALTLLVSAFFRDPDRHSEAPATSVLSPADGRVISAEQIAGGRTRVTIFLSLLNVHVARSPVAGELVACDRIVGGYAAAYREEATRNARVEMLIATSAGEVRVSLMAGLVARRVLPWVAAPMRLGRGQRVAIIRFGSRSEIDLPPGYQAAVAAGAKVRGGETVIAVPLEPVET